MIKLAVLDVAGTTVHDPDGVGTALKSALKASGIPFEQPFIDNVMGIYKPVAIRMVVSEYAPDKLDLVDKIHEEFRDLMIDYYLSHPEVRPIDGAEDAIRQLKSHGIKVALDTGFDRQVLESVLSRVGWDSSLIDATITSDEVAAGRPEPDMIYRLMEMTGVSQTSEVLKAGDTPSDLQEGTNAKCAYVIGVLSGTHSRESLEKEPHTHLLGSVAEIPALLGLS